MSEVVQIQKQKQAIKPPRQYQCVLLNDDYTTVEFVIEVLKRIFSKSSEDAERITMQIHTQGKGVAGVYTKDVADTKAAIVCTVAQRHQHPLKCITEPVDNDD